MASYPEPAPPPAPTPQFDRTHQPLTARPDVADITRRMKNGANNFYWIAALSVINSLVLQFGGNSFFVVGMAGTLMVDFIFIELAAAMPDAAVVVKIIGVLITVFVSGIVALLGVFARRGKRWAFLIGIAAYTIDTLLMLAFQEWMGLLFHGLFLFGLFSGLRALNELAKITPQKPSDFPMDIGR
jgi:hypothetical protein